MTRYRYVEQLNPPAPFVHVSITCPATGAKADGLPAQVDPGPDRTVLPLSVIDTLRLMDDGRLEFQGFEGEIVTLPVYLVAVSVHDRPPVMVRAVLGRVESHVLLGRDVLNSLRMIRDGPNLMLEIE